MATKASTSSAFNSYFYQQAGGGQQTGSGGAKQTANGSEEQSGDIHLKMSKKIAQLTKVIYALNSKNDESENVIAAMRTQFEEEKDQLVQETNRKLEEYKQKILNNSDQSKRIGELEKFTKDLQRQK